MQRTKLTNSRKLKIGYTSGVFDLLHEGHIRYVTSCQSLCDILIIGVDSDRRVKIRKGDHRPILTEKIRHLTVSQINKHTFIKRLNSKYYIFISSDRKHKLKKLNSKYPTKEIITLPYTQQISTSLIISKNA
jgi:cytidyltransferase-like protein